MDKTILNKILAAWFDGSRYLTGENDEYGDTRYVGLHGRRTSEVVANEAHPDSLTVYQIYKGGSYLNAFNFEFRDGTGHGENLRLIGMEGSGHDFRFELARNYSECHTTITMIKQ